MTKLNWDFSTDNWPLPKRVGKWVGISCAKVLGIVWRDRASNNAAPLQLWLFVQPDTQQLYCHAIFACPCLNPVPPNDPKHHCGIDLDPSSLIVLVVANSPFRKWKHCTEPVINSEINYFVLLAMARQVKKTLKCNAFLPNLLKKETGRHLC